jgi:hypothetical protein
MSFFHVIPIAMVLLLTAGAASARQTILAGSVSLLHEYDSNVELTAIGEERGWFTVLSPSMVLTSEAEHDTLSFSYTPGLRYIHNHDETEVDHHLNLEGRKQFSRRLSAKLKENYIRSNDYTYYVLEYIRQRGAGIPLSAERTRRQYWANGFDIAAEYEYARNSKLTGGYTNQILRNDSSQSDDHMKHHPYLSVAYQLNPQWETEFSYDYKRGDFDRSEDFSEHILGGLVNFLRTRHELLFGSYQYATLDYDGDRSGYDLHRGDFGWQRELGPHSTLAASVGLSYADLERGGSETAFNYGANYTRKIKQGEITVGGKAGMDELQFDADPDDGLSRFWSVRGEVDYRLAAALTSNAYFSYREDTSIEAAPESEDRSLVTGLRLAYAFWRWYALAVGYSFRQLDSELPLEGYDDHRFYVQLSVGKELKRWL